MKKVISIILIITALCGVMIPAFAFAGSESAVNMWVNCSDGYRLNVRTEASTNGRIITRLDCGTKVTVLENLGNGWMYISSGKTTGYVMAKFLVSREPGKYEITERSDNFVKVTPYVVTAKALNKNTSQSVGLRVKPNKTANAIRRLNAGDQLQVIERGKVWSKVVDLKTGKTGYVANDYIMKI